MSRILYDLAGADESVRFSPYCWRTKMALRHKGLDIETIPWRITDKAAIAESGQDRVPVLIDNGACLADSWRIACYLDETYADRPALMPGEAGRMAALFTNSWADLTLNAKIRPLSILHIVGDVLGPEDAAYYRESREKMLGKSLEEVCGDQAGALAAFTATLAPVELHLGQSAYLGGEAPTYCDYIVYGSLKWLAVVRGTPCLDDLPAIAAWFEGLTNAPG